MTLSDYNLVTFVTPVTLVTPIRVPIITISFYIFNMLLSDYNLMAGNAAVRRCGGAAVRRCGNAVMRGGR